MSTSFVTKCSILSDIWLAKREDPEFEDFVEYNDLGLPLAFAVEENLVIPNEETEETINETFDMLLDATGQEDIGFRDVDHLLGEAILDTSDSEIEDDEFDEEELSDGGEYRQGFEDGVKAEQERIQAIAQLHMKWAKQLNKGNEFIHWNNVSEIIKPIKIDPSFDDGDF